MFCVRLYDWGEMIKKGICSKKIPSKIVKNLKFEKNTFKSKAILQNFVTVQPSHS